jgi:hypothetical protein
MNITFQFLVDIIVPIVLLLAAIILIKNLNTIFRKLSVKIIDILGFFFFLFPMLSFGLYIYLILTDLYAVSIIISSIFGDPFGVMQSYTSALIFSFVMGIISHLIALLPAVQLYSIKTIISNQNSIQSNIERNR